VVPSGSAAFTSTCCWSSVCTLALFPLRTASIRRISAALAVEAANKSKGSTHRVRALRRRRGAFVRPSPSGRGCREAAGEGFRGRANPSPGPSGHLLPEGEGHFLRKADIYRSPSITPLLSPNLSWWTPTFSSNVRCTFASGIALAYLR